MTTLETAVCADPLDEVVRCLAEATAHATAAARLAKAGMNTADQAREALAAARAAVVAATFAVWCGEAS
jgi:hypothetical protein